MYRIIVFHCISVVHAWSGSCGYYLQVVEGRMWKHRTSDTSTSLNLQGIAWHCNMFYWLSQHIIYISYPLPKTSMLWKKGPPKLNTQDNDRPILREACREKNNISNNNYTFSLGMAQIQTCTHSDSIVPRVKIQLWLVDKPWWIHASMKGLVCFGEMKQQFVPCEQSPHWLEALDMGWRSPPIIRCFMLQ